MTKQQLLEEGSGWRFTPRRVNLDGTNSKAAAMSKASFTKAKKATSKQT